MTLRRLFELLMVGFLAVGLTGCDVDVEDQGELPEVEVEPGEAPDVDVHGPEIDVDEEKETITVPDVDIDTEEKEVTVPDVDVDIPEENDN
ncbi:hypothetical protein [Maioricimonas sp. JC845]|uniref:hypothetical protein n=1 Tax=Maioricimonas sp. JC845 TaxID=3232138 RepID=UPI00345981B5